MARSSNQKLKLLYLMNFLLQRTDEEHPAKMSEIIDYLKSNDISAERKSIYDDIEALRFFGLDIIQVESGKFYGYYVASRTFELPELKLLVDSVQSSKFITHKKTATLIKKIETLASIHEAQLLNRQVFVSNRIKTMNESIYYNVDEIHAGISRHKKIKFRYFEYTVRKERQYRKDGEYYLVSPFAMTWDDENYYLVAFDSDAGIIKHYRVDKMTDISVTEEDCDGKEAFKALDMAVYAKKVFGMFSGSEATVKLRFENHLVGAVLDRLGRDVSIIPDGEEHFTVSADVVPSPQFYAWVCGFSGAAKIIAPDNVVEGMRKHVQAIAEQYGI
jgi:predicted DNA-binding transcriptional regulator YafY